eukprot:scaffold2094_cov239-Pinguiococcus_pyrenoidosus.AAC.7
MDMNRLFGRNILSVLEDAVGIFSPAIQGLVGNERAVDLALARLVCDSDLGKLLNVFDSNPQSDKHLLWNLSESDVREALDPLNEGVLDFAWLATGVPSQTPPLHEMFRICASLHSWLCLDEENIALVLGNRLRISMVVACYLRYIRVVESVAAGFNAFCRRLGGVGLPGAPRRSPVEGLPPSVRTFFQNFNGLVETERWPSTKPLLLKNVLVDGVPVDDLPCLDIFDHNGLIFESHDHEKTHQWQEDSGQGVYHVDRILTGDFYVSCRFGGEHARDTREPRNYLFRYSNSARFLAVGEIGLGVDKVDIREYRQSFEDEGFSMALIFEDAEETSLEGPMANLGSPTRSRSVRPIPDELPVGPCALKMGLIELSMHHIVAPSSGLIQDLCEMGFDRDACRIALQLTNNSQDAAAGLALTISNLFAEMPRVGGRSPTPKDAAGAGLNGDLSGRRHTVPTLSSADSLQNGDSADLADLDAAFSEISAYTGLQMDDLKRLVSDSVQSPGGRYVPPNSTLGTLSIAGVSSCLQVAPDSRGRWPSGDGLLRGTPSVAPKIFRNLENIPAYGDENLEADSKGSDLKPMPASFGEEAISEGQEAPENAPSFGLEEGSSSGSVDGELADDLENIPASEGPAQKDSELKKEARHGTSSARESLDDPEVAPTTEDSFASEDHASAQSALISAKAGDGAREAVSKTAGSDGDGNGATNNSTDGNGRATARVSSAQSATVVASNDQALLKYRLMLRTGTSPEHVAESMQQDGFEPSLLGLETSSKMPEESSASASANASAASSVQPAAESKQTPVEDDPKFADFMKMMKTRGSGLEEGSSASVAPAAAQESKGSAKTEEEQLATEPSEAVEMALKDHPSYSEYFRMLQCGVAKGAVALKMAGDGLDASVLDEDPDKMVRAEKTQVDSEKGEAEKQVGASDACQPESDVGAPQAGANRPALKDDPTYEKYFKMLKSGVPRPAVEHRMQVDGVDAQALDADPEKPFGEEVAPANGEAVAVASVPSASTGAVPLQDDPRFAKYFRMLKSGVPRPAVEHRMNLDGVDMAALDADPSRPFGEAAAPACGGVALQEDPTYSKYFKMLKSGVPRPAVEHRMRLDGIDTAALDADPEKPYGQATGGAAATATATAPAPAASPALKDDPRYAKYLKMLKSGVPRAAVEHRLNLDGLDVSALDANPEEPFGVPLQLPADGSAAAAQPALKDDERFQKYFKMLKSGVPKAAVAHKMQSDGVDPSALDADPDQPFGAGTPAVAAGPPLKDDPKYTKYLKMLKSGVPKAAVAHKMRSDGLDPAALDADPEQPFGTPMAAAAPSAPPLKDDPKYAKYLKMIKSGVPKPAVAHKMKGDGLDPAALDADPNVPFGSAASAAVAPKAPKKAKKRRKRLHWQAVDQSQLGGDSIWLSQDSEVQNLDLKLDDFEMLFVQSNATQAKPKKAAKKSARKEKVALIDGRRATNAGIAIARIKLTYAQMREKITNLEDSSFSTVQMRTLQTFLPTPDEIEKLKGYKGDKKLLNEAEKFMLEMLKLDQGQKRLEAMIYKAQFAERIQQITEDIRTIEKACDDIKLSHRLRKTLKIILRIGNTMNEGEATAFSLDTLTKLSSSKAFDNRTTVLDYLVMVVKRSEEDLLDLADDLKSVQVSNVGAASATLMPTAARAPLCVSVCG